MLNVLTTNKTKPEQRDNKETWGGVESNDGITGVCVWPTHQVSFQRNLQNMTYVLFLVYQLYLSKDVLYISFLKTLFCGFHSFYLEHDSQIYITTLNFFELQTHISNCILDICTWMFNEKYRPSTQNLPMASLLTRRMTSLDNYLQGPT